MTIVCVDVTAEHLPALRPLLLHYWERNWPADAADDFLRWRFLERSDGDAVAAFDGDRCVAIIDSFVRPYIIDGERVRVRESDEWFCLPAYRPLASLRVLQSLMKRPEPIVAPTNSDMTKSVLPRLKWQLLCHQQQCVLPIRIGIAVKTLTKRLGVQTTTLPSFVGRLLPFPLRKPRRAPVPDRSASVTEIEHVEDLPDLLPPQDAYSLYAVADRDTARWFSAAPSGEGRFTWLAFELDGETIGLSLSRTFRDGPYEAASLLHIQSTRRDPAIYAWMISATSHDLAARGAHWIETRSTCPMIVDALEAIGYMKAKSFPVYWWAGRHRTLEGDILVNGMRSKEALTPYPETLTPRTARTDAGAGGMSLDGRGRA